MCLRDPVLTWSLERSWVNIFRISLEVLLFLNHQQTDWEMERASFLFKHCLRVNGSVIMMDRPRFMSSGRRIRTLNGIGTDQYLHWKGSHILLLQRSKNHWVWNPFFRWLQPSLHPSMDDWEFHELLQSISIGNATEMISSQRKSLGCFLLKRGPKVNSCYHASSEHCHCWACFPT